MRNWTRAYAVRLDHESTRKLSDAKTGCVWQDLHDNASDVFLIQGYDSGPRNILSEEILVI
jgi:hypothetical protein